MLDGICAHVERESEEHVIIARLTSRAGTREPFCTTDLGGVTSMGSGGFGFVANPVLLLLIAAVILFVGVWLLMRR